MDAGESTELVFSKHVNDDSTDQTTQCAYTKSRDNQKSIRQRTKNSKQQVVQAPSFPSNHTNAPFSLLDAPEIDMINSLPPSLSFRVKSHSHFTESDDPFTNHNRDKNIDASNSGIKNFNKPTGYRRNRDNTIAETIIGYKSPTAPTTFARDINSVNIDDLEYREGSMIKFHLCTFIKELFYQCLRYFALPIILIFDGGLENARAHGFLPFCNINGKSGGNSNSNGNGSRRYGCSPFERAEIISHLVWIFWFICGVIFCTSSNVTVDVILDWLFEIIILNINFVGCIASYSLKYAYLSQNERKLYFDGDGDGDRDDIINNTRKKTTKTAKANKVKNINMGNAMLVPAWGFYNKHVLGYEFKNTELRLSWDRQSKEDKIIHVEKQRLNNIKNINGIRTLKDRRKSQSQSMRCKKNVYSINIDKYILHLIEESSILQKHFSMFVWFVVANTFLFVGTNVYYEIIVNVRNEKKELLFLISWAIAVFIMLSNLLCFVWATAIDFIRLNWILSMNAQLIIPLHMRLHYTPMVFKSIFSKIVKNIYGHKFIIPKLSKDMDMDIDNDNDNDADKSKNIDETTVMQPDTNVNSKTAENSQIKQTHGYDDDCDDDNIDHKTNGKQSNINIDDKKCKKCNISSNTDTEETNPTDIVTPQSQLSKNTRVKLKKGAHSKRRLLSRARSSRIAIGGLLSSLSSRRNINIGTWKNMSRCMIINIKDIQSLYNWLSVRRYFLEFGKGFRYRELAIAGGELLVWCFILIRLFMQTIIYDEFNSIKIGLAIFMMIQFLIPIFTAIHAASQIQKTFKLEINLLKKRNIGENMRYSQQMEYTIEKLLKQPDDNQEITIDNKLYFQAMVQFCKYHSNRTGLDTIVDQLKDDFDEYSFKIFGIRIDQGIVHLVYPVVIGMLSVVVRIVLAK